MRRTLSGGVEHVRIEIDAIWPHNGSCVSVDTDLRKEVLVLKRGEHPTASADPLREIHNAAGAIKVTRRGPNTAPTRAEIDDFLGG